MQLKYAAWERLAACSATPENRSWEFFSEIREEQNVCISICMGCPVRRECAEFALNNQHISGIWAGLREKEVRELLSVDEFGEPHFYASSAWCPMCCSEMRRPLMRDRQKVKRGQVWIECVECNFGFARYETNDYGDWATPSVSRKNPNSPQDDELNIDILDDLDYD
jgi:hypothetical protein